MKKIDARSDGTLAFSVRLSPRASRDAIVGWTPAGSLKVSVRAAPVDDAANRALIELLCDTLGVPRSQITIASGLRARTKRLVVPSAFKNRLLRLSDI